MQGTQYASLSTALHSYSTALLLHFITLSLHSYSTSSLHHFITSSLQLITYLYIVFLPRCVLFPLFCFVDQN